MLQDRRAAVRAGGSSGSRRHRWLIGAVGVLGASGLVFGGLGVPVSADDVNVSDQVHASAAAEGGCVTVTGGTGGAGGSIGPSDGSDPSQLEAAGQGTATVSVCGNDPGGTPPGDPGGAVPGDLDDVVPGDLGDVPPGDPGDVPPGDLDDVVPGDPGDSAEALVGLVADVLEGGTPGGGGTPVPGDGDGDVLGAVDGLVPGEPGSGLPGDPGGVVPGGVGGLVPDGSGLVSDLLDRLARIIPDGIDAGDPGDTGGGPSNGAGASGTVSGSVDVANSGAERGVPTGQPAVDGTGVDGVGSAEGGTAVSPGATLPRTGGGLGSGVLRLVAFMGLARVLVGLAGRRRVAPELGRS